MSVSGWKMGFKVEKDADVGELWVSCLRRWKGELQIDVFGTSIVVSVLGPMLGKNSCYFEY